MSGRQRGSVCVLDANEKQMLGQCRSLWLCVCMCECVCVCVCVCACGSALMHACLFAYV